MAIMEVRKYTVTPAVNGWLITFQDENTANSHQAVFKTSAEVANFFKSMDKARAAAQKQLAAPKR